MPASPPTDEATVTRNRLTSADSLAKPAGELIAARPSPRFRSAASSDDLRHRSLANDDHPTGRPGEGDSEEHDQHDARAGLASELVKRFVREPATP